MKWSCVFRAKGPAEAWLVRDWLQHNGVDATVRGDQQSVRGQMPVLRSWPSVWVSEEAVEDAERALEIYNKPRLVHPSWRCGGCGEENEATFGSCWQCGADGPAVAGVGGGEPR